MGPLILEESARKKRIFVLFCFLISMSIHYENMSPKQGTMGSRSTGEWEEGQMLVLLHWDGLWDVCGHTWGPNPC